MNSTDRLHGLLLGTALGDSVGLPCEGLTPKAIAQRGWDRDWQQRLFFGRGMWSDDTEHTIILTQALSRSGGDSRLFEKHLARGLKFWLLFFPAGVGLATARSLFKLWLGFPSKRSGVFSAGNGPMMRAAPLGIILQDEPEKRLEFNHIQTRLTHTDPKEEFCSRAIVELACHFAQSPNELDIDVLFQTISFPDADSDFTSLLRAIRQNLEAKQSLSQLLLLSLKASPEKGVSGYCYHTLAAVLHCGITHNWHPERSLAAIWSAGGDTDTMGAILGALCGSLHGPNAFPDNWLSALQEFPTHPESFKPLAQAAITHQPCVIRHPFHPLLLARNLLFLTTVLVHGFARLFRRKA